MLIAGVNFGLQPWPIPKTYPAIGKWKKLSNGFKTARDRGQAQDIYEASVSIEDSPEVIKNLQSVLEANKNQITLSGFNSVEMPFGANVNYSGSINATVKNFGIRKNLYNNVFYKLEITFRAIAPTLLSTTPSISGLNLQEGFEGDKTTDITKLFSYGGQASYMRHKTDSGFFTGRFLQNTQQMKAIRAYLLEVARANAIPFPKMGNGIFYPFGTNESDSRFQMCNITEWEDRQIGFDLWELDITFSQAEPYFMGGDSDTEEASSFMFAPDDDEPQDFFMTPEF